MDTQAFMGLSKKSAQNLAEQRNLIFYLIRIDENNFFSYPEEQRDDRVCIEIDAGKVSKASIQ